MKTPTLLAASTRNGFRYLGALALTAALAGCSGAVDAEASFVEGP